MNIHFWPNTFDRWCDKTLNVGTVFDVNNYINTYERIFINSEGTDLCIARAVNSGRKFLCRCIQPGYKVEKLEIIAEVSGMDSRAINATIRLNLK